MDKFHYNFAGLKILEQPVLHKLGNFHSGVIEDSSLLAWSTRYAASRIL